MPHDPPRLSVPLLDDLARRWADNRLPLVEHLRPGVSDTEIAAAAGELGFELPGEVKTWWRWHDGAPAPRESPELGEVWLMTPDFPFISLKESIAVYHEGRERIIGALRNDLPEESAMDELNRLWPRHWLPLTFEAGWTFCDCSGGPDDPVPIRWMDTFEMPDPRPPRLRSLGELVARWIDCWDRSLWSYSPADGSWEVHDDRWTEAETKLRVR